MAFIGETPPPELAIDVQDVTRSGSETAKIALMFCGRSESTLFLYQTGSISIRYSGRRQ